MKRSELVKLLRFCPLSELFGESELTISNRNFSDASLRHLALDLVHQFSWQNLDAISERSPLQEISSNERQRRLIEMQHEDFELIEQAESDDDDEEEKKEDAQDDEHLKLIQDEELLRL